MEPLRAENIQGNGLALQRLQDVFSKVINFHYFTTHFWSYFSALSGRYTAAGLHVYIAGDGADIYQDSFFKVAMGREGKFTPTLILVGIRLGIDRVTPSYWPSLRESLKLPQSIGIAGLVSFQFSSFWCSNTNISPPPQWTTLLIPLLRSGPRRYIFLLGSPFDTSCFTLARR